MPNFIRFNLHPLETHLQKEGENARSHPSTRTVVTDDEVYVYVDGSSGPELWFNDRLEDFSGDAATGWVVQTSEGWTLRLVRVNNCGCGSRLKGFNPFPGIPYGKM